MKVVLVTGAASGAGWAIACACYLRGDGLVLVDERREALERRDGELHARQRVLSLAGRLSEDDFRLTLCQAIRRHYGRLDQLFLAEGMLAAGLEDEDGGEASEVLARHLEGPMLLARQCEPMLRDSRGSLIILANAYSLVPAPDRPARAAAQAGLLQFFESRRAGLARRGVHLLQVQASAVVAAGDEGDVENSSASRPVSSSAAALADKILAAAHQRRRWLFHERRAWLGALLWRLWPSAYLAVFRDRESSAGRSN